MDYLNIFYDKKGDLAEVNELKNNQFFFIARELLQFILTIGFVIR